MAKAKGTSYKEEVCTMCGETWTYASIGVPASSCEKCGNMIRAYKTITQKRTMQEVYEKHLKHLAKAAKEKEEYITKYGKEAFDRKVEKDLEDLFPLPPSDYPKDGDIVPVRNPDTGEVTEVVFRDDRDIQHSDEFPKSG